MNDLINDDLINDSENLENGPQWDFSEVKNGNSDDQKSKAEYEEIKKALISEKQKAEHILNVLKSLTANGEIFKELFETIKKEIELSHDEIKKTKWINTKLYNDLSGQETKIKSVLENARAFLIDAKTIKNNLVLIEKELISKKENVLKIKEEVEKMRKESKDLKYKIKDELKQINHVWEEIDKILGVLKKDKELAGTLVEYIKTVNAEAKKNQIEMNALLNKWKESLKKIKEDEKKVSDLSTTTDTKAVKILSWYERLFNPWGIKDKINGIETKIKENQSIIENQLSQASSNRLTTTLKSKLDKTEKTLNFWRKWTIWIASWLTTISIWIYIVSSLNNSFKLDIWKYIELIYPVIFLLIFFTLQYSRTSKFYEEYYFKYISAFWLPAYFELLESKNDERAVEYLIKTIEKIHTNPTQEINSNTKDNMFDYVLDWAKGLMGAKTLDLNKVLKDLTKEQIWGIWEFLQEKILK